jgi:hypothetical protein
MRKLLWVMTVPVLTFAVGGMMAQSRPLKVVAQFPGASLKWIHIAEPEFQQKHLDLDNYIVTVVEHEDSMGVMLTSRDSKEETRGSSGTFPNFAVEISKKDMKVIRSSYDR